MTSNYSDPTSLDFHSEPEPQPPALGFTNSAHDTYSMSTGSPAPRHKPTSSTDGHGSKTQTESRDQERTWTSLSLPGAMLNSAIYIIGRSIELLAPYWPSSQERKKIVTWATSHPILTSFLLFQALFILGPTVGFVAFMASMAAMLIGAAVVFIIAVGLGGGVIMLIPGALIAAVWGAIIWAWTFVGWRVAGIVWGVYKCSEHFQKSHSASGASSDASKVSEKRGFRKKQMGGGDYSAEDRGSQTNSSHEEFTMSKTAPTFSEEIYLPKEEVYDEQRTYEKGSLKKEKEYTDTLKQGGRDEDRVGRDIAASLG